MQIIKENQESIYKQLDVNVLTHLQSGQANFGLKNVKVDTKISLLFPRYWLCLLSHPPSFLALPSQRSHFTMYFNR